MPPQPARTADAPCPAENNAAERAIRPCVIAQSERRAALGEGYEDEVGACVVVRDVTGAGPGFAGVLPPDAPLSGSRGNGLNFSHQT